MPNDPQLAFKLWDWAVLILYLALTFGIALRVRFGLKKASDYFLAGRSMPWFVVGISMFATLFSTNSFVAVPGAAYKFGILGFLTSVGYALFVPLAVWLFLKPFYSQGTSFTAYEYLEKRFSVTVRMMGALIFLVCRALYGATVFYAASKLFYSMVGWEPEVTILVLGVCSVLYTTIGGMKAVMLTDVLQVGAI